MRTGANDNAMNRRESAVSGPLEGIRVIDVTEVISGPLATMILADQGADVVKVEPPKYGEESRQLANFRAGMAAMYLNCNHGKRSIGINLVLAFAGAPVSAQKMVTIPLRRFTSISINDSLSDGISFFYA